MQRRLNRHEYENALRDLLQCRGCRSPTACPRTARRTASTRAARRSTSPTSRWRGTQRVGLRHAAGDERAARAPAATTNRYYARDEPSLRNWRPRENGTLPDRLSFPVLDSHAQPDVRAGRAPADPADARARGGRQGVEHLQRRGRLQLERFRAPVAGRYKLRFGGYTIWVGGGGVARWFYEGQGAEKAPVYHTLLWHRPNLDEVYPGPARRADRRLRARRRPDPAGRESRFQPEPTVSEIEVFLAANEVDADRGLAAVPHAGQRHGRAVRQPAGAPRTACPATPSSGSRSKGRSTTSPAAAGYRLLFDDLPLKRSEAGRTGVPLEVGAPAPAHGGPGGPGAAGARGGPRRRPGRRSHERGDGTKSNPRIRSRTPSGCCDRS